MKTSSTHTIKSVWRLQTKWIKPAIAEIRWVAHSMVNALLKGAYKATVRDKEHIGSTGVFFKTRWQQHKYSILKKQPWLNSLYQIISNFPKLNGKFYLNSTAQYLKRQIIALCIWNLERMAIAEADRFKLLILENN